MLWKGARFVRFPSATRAGTKELAALIAAITAFEEDTRAPRFGRASLSVELREGRASLVALAVTPRPSWLVSTSKEGDAGAGAW
ncbi:MAG: hypothetical protein QXH42_08390 [Thermoplasmata archaeon]